MFGSLPVEIILAIGGMIAAVISFIAGGRNEKHKADAKRAETDLEAMIRRKELNDDLEDADPDERRKRLERWVREAK